MSRNKTPLESIQVIFAKANNKSNCLKDIVDTASNIQDLTQRTDVINSTIQFLCKQTGPEITGTHLVNTGKKLINLLSDDHKPHAANLIANKMAHSYGKRPSIRSLTKPQKLKR